MQQTSDFGHRLSCGTAIAARQESALSNTVNPFAASRSSHQLYFASLFDPGRALSFPCDGRGEVQLDALSERARINYFFARTTVGRDFGHPTVITLENCSTH